MGALTIVAVKWHHSIRRRNSSAALALISVVGRVAVEGGLLSWDFRRRAALFGALRACWWWAAVDEKIRRLVVLCGVKKS
jgi:hypothetical protein